MVCLLPTEVRTQLVRFATAVILEHEDKKETLKVIDFGGIINDQELSEDDDSLVKVINSLKEETQLDVLGLGMNMSWWQHEELRPLLWEFIKSQKFLGELKLSYTPLSSSETEDLFSHLCDQCYEAEQATSKGKYKIILQKGNASYKKAHVIQTWMACNF